MRQTISIYTRIFCAGILAITACSTPFAQTYHKQQSVKAEKEVIAFLDTLTDAGLKRDVATLDRLYADDYFHTNADGSLMTKAQVIASYKAAPTATIESDQHDEDKVWIHGDMAFVNTRVTIKGQAQNNPFVRQWRITYLFERVKGQWRAVTSHATLILQPSK